MNKSSSFVSILAIIFLGIFLFYPDNTTKAEKPVTTILTTTAHATTITTVTEAATTTTTTTTAYALRDSTSFLLSYNDHTRFITYRDKIDYEHNINNIVFLYDGDTVTITGHIMNPKESCSEAVSSRADSEKRALAATEDPTNEITIADIVDVFVYNDKFYLLDKKGNLTTITRDDTFGHSVEEDDLVTVFIEHSFYDIAEMKYPYYRTTSGKIGIFYSGNSQPNETGELWYLKNSTEQHFEFDSTITSIDDAIELELEIYRNYYSILERSDETFEKLSEEYNIPTAAIWRMVNNVTGDFDDMSLFSISQKEYNPRADFWILI